MASCCYSTASKLGSHKASLWLLSVRELALVHKTGIHRLKRSISRKTFAPLFQFFSLLLLVPFPLLPFAFRSLTGPSYSGPLFQRAGSSGFWPAGRC